MRHDLAETLVHLLERPLTTLGVLRHLECGGRNTTCIRRLRRCKEYLVALEIRDRIEGRRHIRPLADRLHAICNELLCRLQINLALRRARQCNIALHRPDTAAALMVLCIWMGRCILLDACAADFLDVLDRREIDAVRIVDVAVRVGTGHDLRAKLLCLLDGIDCDVARAGDDDRLACEVDALRRKHILNEV